MGICERPRSSCSIMIYGQIIPYSFIAVIIFFCAFGLLNCFWFIQTRQFEAFPTPVGRSLSIQDPWSQTMLRREGIWPEYEKTNCCGYYPDNASNNDIFFVMSLRERESTELKDCNSMMVLQTHIIFYPCNGHERCPK